MFDKKVGGQSRKYFVPIAPAHMSLLRTCEIRKSGELEIKLITISFSTDYNIYRLEIR